jgi:hypothetical protein
MQINLNYHIFADDIESASRRKNLILLFSRILWWIDQSNRPF